MITRGSAANSSAWRSRDRAHAVARSRSRRGRAGRTSRAGSGSVRNRSTPARKRRAAGRGPCDTAVARPPNASSDRAHAERRAERVGIGVLVADHERVPGVREAREDRRRDGVAREGRQVDRAGSSLVLPCASRRRCGVRAGRPVRRAGHRGRGVAVGRRAGSTGGAAGSAGARPRRRPRRARPSGLGVALVGQPLDGLRQRLVVRARWRPGPCPRRAPGAGGGRGSPAPSVSSRWTWSVRDALDPQRAAQLVADEPHRVLERAQRLLLVGLAADDADPDLRVPKIRRRLHVGDGHEPDPRDPRSPSRAATPISWRSSSSMRSVRWSSCAPSGAAGRGVAEPARAA